MCYWQINYKADNLSMYYTLFEGLCKITGFAVYFSNLWGLIFRVRITNKGQNTFLEKA